MSRKIIVTVAPTGGFLTKRDTPHIPTQPNEIAEDVQRCYNAGASVVALHARRADDQATCDPAIYRRINASIRDRCDIVINNSTGGGINGDLVVPTTTVDGIEFSDRHARESALAAGAEICSLNAMTVLAHHQGRKVLMSTDPDQSLDLARRMVTAGIKPEFEVFNPAHLLQDVSEAIHQHIDPGAPLVNFCFNLHHLFQGAVPYSPRMLQYLVDQLPDSAIFGVSCGGQDQIQALVHAIILGGHIRIGIEDNRYGVDGEVASNAGLVEHAVKLIEQLGFAPATAAEARTILGLGSPTTAQQHLTAAP